MAIQPASKKIQEIIAKKQKCLFSYEEKRRCSSLKDIVERLAGSLNVLGLFTFLCALLGLLLRLWCTFLLAVDDQTGP